MVFLQSSPITPSTRGCWCWKCPSSLATALCLGSKLLEMFSKQGSPGRCQRWSSEFLTIRQVIPVFYQKIKDKTFWRFTIKMSSSEKFHIERSRRKRIFLTAPWAVGPARSRQTSSSCQPAHPSLSPSSDRTLARTHCSTSRAWSSLTCRQSSGEVNVAF